MDISVSRLNKRMALQLPAEFPLGLVFVVGKVRNLTNIDGEGGPAYFYLIESDYMLRCQLSERALEGITLNEGDMIRAGGHLAFDSMQADYYLLARDIEVLPEHRPNRTTLAPILSDIKKRSQAASLAPAELPDWVQQMAPLELREEEREHSTAVEAVGQPVRLQAAQEAAEAETFVEPRPEATLTREAAVSDTLPGGFTDDLVNFLSEAMDSPEDVELTHDMVAELAPAIRPEPDPQPAKPAAASAVKTEARVPWAVVFLVLFFLISFLGLMLLLALLAARQF